MYHIVSQCHHVYDDVEYNMIIQHHHDSSSNIFRHYLIVSYNQVKHIRNNHILIHSPCRAESKRTKIQTTKKTHPKTKTSLRMMLVTSIQSHLRVIKTPERANKRMSSTTRKLKARQFLRPSHPHHPHLSCVLVKHQQQQWQGPGVILQQQLTRQIL